jgi:hypothetical protein
VNQQEPEIEYVQGYDDLEEEDDIEDFGGFAIDESLKNNGKVFFFFYKESSVVWIFHVPFPSYCTLTAMSACTLFPVIAI